MSIQIKIPGVDFSGLGLPRLRRLVSGFVFEDLEALYLVQDVAAGQPVSLLKDASGKGRDASLVGGSATQNAQGLVCGANGAAFQTPVAVAGPYTVVTVGNIGHAAAASGMSTYPASTLVPGQPGDGYFAAATASYNTATAANARPTINRDLSSGGANRINAALYARAGAIGSGIRRTVNPIPVGPEQSYAAAGYSISSDQIRSTIGLADLTSEYVSTDGSLAASLSNPGAHVVGAIRYGATNSLLGSGLQLAAIFNKEYRGADLLAAVARAKAIVAARGVTVY